MRCGVGSLLGRRVTSRRVKNPMLSDQGSVRFREARAAKSDNVKVGRAASQPGRGRSNSLTIA